MDTSETGGRAKHAAELLLLLVLATLWGASCSFIKVGVQTIPPVTLIAALALGETLTASAWLGMACVLVGVLAMTIPARQSV